MSNKGIDKVAKIRKLNDLLRRYGIGGQILLTRSIRSKSKEEIAEMFLNDANEMGKTIYGEV